MGRYLGRKPKPHLKKIAKINARYLYQGDNTVFYSRGADITVTDIKAGSNQPQWSKRIAEKLDAGSPYTRSYYWKVIKNPSISWVWVYNKASSGPPVLSKYGLYGWFLAANFDRNIYSTGVDWARTASVAKIAFLGKVNEEISSFSGGTFLGELRETVRMIRNPLHGIRSVTKRYYRQAARALAGAQKRQRLRGVKEWRKPWSDESFRGALQQAYLEWTYGMVPLLNDAQSIGEAVAKIVQNDQNDSRVQVTVKSPNTQMNLLKNRGDPLQNYVLMQATEVKASVRIVGAVKHDIKSSCGRALQETGIAWNQFVPTAWELIPYSFLVDYVVNVGDVLGAAFTDTRHLRYVWQTTRETRHVHVVGIPLPGTVSSPKPVSSPTTVYHAEFKGISINRTVPSLQVSLRDLRFQDYTVRHAVNATVLALEKYRMLPAWRDSSS